MLPLALPHQGFQEKAHWGARRMLPKERRKYLGCGCELPQHWIEGAHSSQAWPKGSQSPFQVIQLQTAARQEGQGQRGEQHDAFCRPLGTPASRPETLPLPPGSKSPVGAGAPDPASTSPLHGGQVSRKDLVFP